MKNKSNLLRQVIITDDGSSSIYVPGLDESYHSRFGAWQEAEHIFIRSALQKKAVELNKLNVLELGFGTGLNALLTLQFAMEHKKEIKYTGIEKYPLQEEELKLLNYGARRPEFREMFENMHRAPWGKEVAINANFRLTKIQSDFREMELPTGVFDVVYFDAFGPDIQADLWSDAVFQQIEKAMSAGAVLCTYSVKGSVRRAMKAAGLKVEKIPGPPGKREISRAYKL